VSLSKAQIEERDKFKTHLFLHERDLLEAARRWAPWRIKAHELGFQDLKIDAPWTHSDAGRQIKYMRIEEIQSHVNR